MPRQKAALLRETILDAAIELFRKQGLAHTSTRDLTESLGISRSHIYHYFPNWQALTRAALERFMQNDLASARAELNELPPERAMELLVAWFVPQHIDAEWMLYADAWQESLRIAEWKTMAIEITEAWNVLVREIIDRGIASGIWRQIDSARAARQINALVNGYADVISLDTSEAPRQQALEDIHALIALMLPPL